MVVTMATVHADWDSESEMLLLAQNLSLDKAAKQLQKSINGRILEAKTIQIDSKKYYRFKVLTEKEGRVRYIKIDPVTGLSTKKQ